MNETDEPQSHMSIQEQAQRIQQKYMSGFNAKSQVEQVFKAPYTGDGTPGHAVPVSNFLNAQCMFAQIPRLQTTTNRHQTFQRSPSVRHLRRSRSFSTPVAPTFGSQDPSAARSPATCTPSTMRRRRLRTRRTAPSSRSSTALAS
jgi:hypothetical protein